MPEEQSSHAPVLRVLALRSSVQSPRAGLVSGKDPLALNARGRLRARDNAQPDEARTGRRFSERSRAFACHCVPLRAIAWSHRARVCGDKLAGCVRFLPSLHRGKFEFPEISTKRRRQGTPFVRNDRHLVLHLFG